LHKNNPNKVNHFWIIFILIISGSILLLSISDLHFLSKKAYAHSLPISQTPSHDSILKKEELPSKVVIDFSERPVPGVSTIQVVNEKNERVDNGNFVIIGDHDREAMTTLDTKKLTDGVYTVSWLTQSADDGHIAKGSYVFGIGNVGQSTSGITSSPSMRLTNNEQQYKVQAITSSLDGLIKWPLIISQVTVVGVIFSHLFLWESYGKKIMVNTNQGTVKSANTIAVNNMMTDLRYSKRFSLILLAVSVTIIVSANVLLFLQITELSPNNDISSYASIFLSLLQGPSGFLWLVRIITSIIIIVSAIIYYCYYYYSSINNSRKIKSKTGHNDQYQLENRLFYKIKKNGNLFPLTLLSIAFVAGCISIFSNSLTSHNAAVNFFPSVAVSLDWLHFMAISVWVGGLFYISTILLVTIRDKTNDETRSEYVNSQKTRMPTEIFSVNLKKRFIFHYYLALLLPRFSLVATLSLGIIGISGIYMAWINLHNFNFLFESEYGNILIIKLITVIPLILLGGYHQLKLHNTIVKVAGLGKNGENININDNINKNSIDINKYPKKYTIQEENPEKIKLNKIDIFGKFNRTIKIESLVAIGVLLVASLLTTTSPPTTTMSMPPMNDDDDRHTMVMPDGDGGMSMNGMSMSNLKNSSYIKEVKILNVNTKIEINPFHSGFNTFKITFTDTNGQPYSKFLTVRMIFKNNQADIGPITTKLNKLSPGVYTVRGGYISQPGEWNVAMSAQRPSDYDLNYKFNPLVNSSSSGMNQTSSSSNATKAANVNNNDSKFFPIFDSFTLLAIILAIFVGVFSSYFYKKNKQKLRKTIDFLNSKYK
jgi:putative copper export protein/methionine-rich copper-binding protein CopC